PVLAGEELQRVHLRDLVAGISRDLLEIAVPAQQLQLLVVEIQDAGHAFDDRVGEGAPSLPFPGRLAARPRGRNSPGRRTGPAQPPPAPPLPGPGNTRL